MNCGHSSARSSTRNGFGWHSTAIHARSSEWRLAHALKRPHASCGRPCLHSIVNVRSVTPIFGRHMQQSFRPSAIVQSARKAVIPAISSASTTRCANGVVVWCAKRSHSRKIWPIILAHFGILCITITLSDAPNSLPLLLHDYPVIAWYSQSPAAEGLPGCRAPQHTTSFSLPQFGSAVSGLSSCA